MFSKSIRLQAILHSEKNLLQTLLKDYFLEIEPSMINEEGEVEYPYLDTYWEAPRRHPYFLMFDQECVGFVLVNDWVLDSEFDAQYSVAEFYVKPAFRRKGIGQRAMQLFWEQYPGRWEIRQQLQNLPAQTFWRSILQKGGVKFQEKRIGYKSDSLVVQLFEISGNQ